MRLNSRPLLATLLASLRCPEPRRSSAAVVAIDKLDKETPDAVAAELTAKGVPGDAARALLDLHAAVQACGRAPASPRSHAGPALPRQPLLDELRDVLAITPPLPSGRLRFDPFLARGMDYYTGPIFEIGAAGRARSASRAAGASTSWSSDSAGVQRPRLRLLHRLRARSTS